VIVENLINKNYLQGMRCPRCGSIEPFRIASIAIVLIFDKGPDDYRNDEWVWDDFAACMECNWNGKVRDLKDKAPVRALTEGHVNAEAKMYGQPISSQLCFSLGDPQDEEDETMASLLELCEDCSCKCGEGSMVYHPKEGIEFEVAALAARKRMGL
jgi:hypothetical protein